MKSPKTAEVRQCCPAEGGRGLVRMEEFIETFLSDCQSRWKPATFDGHCMQARGKIKKYFGKKFVSAVTSADVRSWRDAYIGSYGVPLSVLSSIFQHAESVGHRKPGSNPCSGLRRRKSGFVANYPDGNNYRDIWMVLDQIRDKESVTVDLLRFLILTGCRRGEALNLKWTQIESNKAALTDSKSGPGTIWLNKPALELLDLQGRKPTGYVFYGKSRRHLNKKLTAMWRRIRSTLGLHGMRVHDMRHGFASVGVSSGENLRTIGRALGHRDPKTTVAYAHLAFQPVIDASQRVSSHLGHLLDWPGSPKNEGDKYSVRTEYEGEAYSYLERFICQKLSHRTA